MNIKDLLEKYKFSEEEKSFINQANTAVTADMNQSRIVSELILGKRIEEVANNIIKSNEKLADSNKKYSKGLLWLTAALVFVGLIQIIIQFLE